MEFPALLLAPIVDLRHASGAELIARVIRPSSVWELHMGLLVRPPLGPGEALWLNPCGSVHTFGMRYAIDVLFLDAELQVLRVAAHVRPWGVRLAPARTRSVIELRAGAADGVKVGDRLAVG